MELKYRPAILSTLVQLITDGTHTNTYLLNYADDLTIYKKDMLRALKPFVNHWNVYMQQAFLLKLSKPEILFSKLEVIRSVVSGQTLEMPPKFILAIVDFPKPKTN